MTASRNACETVSADATAATIFLTRFSAFCWYSATSFNILQRLKSHAKMGSANPARKVFFQGELASVGEALIDLLALLFS